MKNNNGNASTRIHAHTDIRTSLMFLFHFNSDSLQWNQESENQVYVSKWFICRGENLSQLLSSLNRFVSSHFRFVQFMRTREKIITEYFCQCFFSVERFFSENSDDDLVEKSLLSFSSKKSPSICWITSFGIQTRWQNENVLNILKHRIWGIRMNFWCLCWFK